MIYFILIFDFLILLSFFIFISKELIYLAKLGKNVALTEKIFTNLRK